MAGATQIRTGVGGTIGFDYVALKTLAEDFGVETSPAFWRKVRAVANVIRKTEARAASRRTTTS